MLEPKIPSSFFNKWWGENWRNSCTTMQLDSYPTPFRKTHSKWIKDLSVRPDTIKLLKENVEKKLIYTVLGDDFLKTRHQKHKQQK